MKTGISGFPQLYKDFERKLMKLNPRLLDWEDEDFDDDEGNFIKLTHKAKLTKQREQDVIRQKRKEKMRKRELYESENI